MCTNLLNQCAMFICVHNKSSYSLIRLSLHLKNGTSPIFYNCNMYTVNSF